jgi:hypothetical protein
VWAKSLGVRYPRGQPKYEENFEPSKDDGRIVDFILELFRSEKGREVVQRDTERHVFNIYKSLSLGHGDEFKGIIMFIRHILSLEYSTPRLAFSVIYEFLEGFGLKTILWTNKEVGAKYLKKILEQDYYEKLEKKTKFIFLRLLIEGLCETYPVVLNNILDISISFESSSLLEIFGWLLESCRPEVLKLVDDHADEDNNNSYEVCKALAEFLCKYLSDSFNSKRNDVIEMLRKKNLRDIEKRTDNTNEKDEKYFDFLIVQNECVKAQEEMRTTLSNEISVLKGENVELKRRNENLHEAIQTMELELNEFQETLIKDITRMLNESKTRCNKLEEENISLKSQIHKLKGSLKEKG